MNDAAERDLIIKYPLLFGREGRRRHAEVWGIGCEDGWAEILNTLCSEIQSYIDKNNLEQVRFSYVKEKFGELRVSCICADEYVSSLASKALQVSIKTCEWCGQPGSRKRLRPDWVKTLCEPCETQALKRIY